MLENHKIVDKIDDKKVYIVCTVVGDRVLMFLLISQIIFYMS